MLSHDDDIIIAQCTPQGKGAIALLRLSGKDVRNLVTACSQLPGSKNLQDVPSHTIHYGWIVDTNQTKIDEVLFLVMDGPKTFTGDNVIEITCHNNAFLIESIIELLIKKGARLAQEGEFTKRAFLHGKIDLVQAEAINELIGAQTQAALKKSLSQLEGSFSYWISSLEKDLTRALAWCEASFEFLDEEAEFGERIQAALIDMTHKIDQINQTYDIQQQLRQGVRIALIGSVNAGKSSLFNALLKQKRAIVTDIAGTTRDAIEASISYKGNRWTFVDTAGLRQTADVIEQEGIRRSYEEAHKADVIVVVIDQSRAATEQEKDVYADILEKYKSKCIVVQNKTDLPEHSSHAAKALKAIKISSSLGTEISSLQDAIAERIDQLFGSLDSPFLLNQRHHVLLMKLKTKIEEIIPMLHGGSIQYELVSYHLHDALTLLSELTGKSVSEAGLDMVFKEFCVGK